MRKKYAKLSHAESDKRNNLMFKQYEKLLKKKYGKMKIYQTLADQFDLEERNSVAAIINKMRKVEPKKQLSNATN